MSQEPPPSSCKQGLDCSTCPESKHKYLFLLCSYWHQDTTQVAQKPSQSAGSSTWLIFTPCPVAQLGRRRGRERAARFVWVLFHQASQHCILLHSFLLIKESSLQFTSTLFFSLSIWLNVPFLCPAHPATKSLIRLLREGYQYCAVTQSSMQQKSVSSPQSNRKSPPSLIHTHTLEHKNTKLGFGFTLEISNVDNKIVFIGY